MSDSHPARLPDPEKTRQLVSALLKKKGISLPQKEAVPRRLVYSPCPASFAQQRLWLLEQMSPGSRYNMQFVLRLTGPLNTRSLVDAWQEILKRHESLRTTFGVVDDEIVQFISPEPQSSLALMDLTGHDDSERESRVKDLVEKQGEETFDLANGPLVRPVVLKVGAEKYILSLTMHHIIFDGWSLVVLMRELTELYVAFDEGRSNPLQPPLLQYADFAYWQRQRLSGDLLETHLSYWRKQLSDALVLELPTDHPRPKKESFRGSHRAFLIPEDIAERLRELGRRNHASLFMVLLTAWQVLMYRYSSQSDVAVGVTIANRTRVEIERLIGFFVNTLVLRTDLSSNPTFKEALSRVRRTTLDAYDHQEVPYEKLVAELRPERTASQTPFFGTMLNWVNTPESGLEFAGMPWEFVPLENSTAKFDLSLAVVEREGAVPASLEYSTDIYEETTIVRMSRHFQTLLAGIAINADQFLSELPLLGEDERRQVLFTWNQQERECPTDETLLELLETQARKSPDTPAVIFEGESSSYRELHQQANQLAHFLKKLGVGPEVPVGVCMERSTQLVIALLGILKAGGAYVPLDPNYPAERLRYTLEDSRAPVLLIDNSFAARESWNQVKTIWSAAAGAPIERRFCAQWGGGALGCEEKSLQADKIPNDGDTEKLKKVREGTRLVRVEEEWEAISTESQETIESSVDGENLAYVIYTSGSTGKPKGVAIRHNSAAVMLRWAHQVFSARELSGILASTSVCFDLSVFEIFAPLSCGGSVYMAGNALELASLAEAGGTITLVNTVPSVMRELVRIGAIPESVRTVNLAGEALPVELVRDVYANSSVERVFNLYGPSEDTTYSTYACMERDAVTAPIGRPIANTRAYILDEWMQPAPAGVVGELYLAGGGLARGYWQRAELTAEKFLPDPFSAREGERLYRTGDLARWRGDGNIEYAGRKDQQIKLRGYRIELGEIETVLRQYEAVQQAIVAVQEEEDGKEKRLIAYVVPAGGGRLETAALRNYVEEKLPGYMVPSAFVELQSLPLTANGKVNRKALPHWEFTESEAKQEQPRTPTEELLAGIWNEVLGIEHIGIHANFFELGGHSLLAMQVTSRLRSALQVELPFSAIFAAPTIHRLAAQIERNRRESVGQALPPLKPTQQSGPHPLSFAQRRLWFMDRLHPLSTFYNISGALRLSGDLDLTALEGAWAAVAERHQVFHTQFELKDEEPVQAIENDARLKLEQEDLSALRPEEREKHLHERIEKESQRHFDLGRAPLAKVLLLRLAEQEHVLFISMHHIISDGWSLNVLVRELTELYAAFSQGRPSPLPPLPVQYVDYARWQRGFLQGAVLEKQLSYWRTQLGNVPVLELPTDWPRPAQENFRGAYYSFLVPSELVAGLRNLARSQRSTLFMLLLAAWETLLYRYSGQTDFTVGMPVANRSLPETEGLIGFFVNTLALRSDLNDDPNFMEVLQRVRRTTLEAYDHQDLPFEELVAALRPERSLGQNPLFRVMFNWANMPRSDLKLSGIKWEMVPQQHNTTHFDLTLTAGEQDGDLPAGFEYSTGLYEEPTIAQMANHLLVVLNAIVQDPECPVATMPLLTEGEREQLLFTWNQSTVELGHVTCIHELIESQTRSTPDAIAILADDATLTYADLDRRANQIAHWLQSRGVGAETLVGVCLAPSSQMLVVLFGILKAGGTYVPLDPVYPPARLQYMVQDSGLKLLLTETSLQTRLASLPVECVCLDSLDEELAHCGATPCRKVGPENAAYVIYTSGSTGRSKGVVARHSSVANQVLWMKAAFGLTSSDRVIHKASVSFDASVAEIFAPLAAGSQVIVTRPNAQHDIDGLVRVIKDQEVTFIDLSPTLLRALLEHPEIQQCSSLRCIVSGGEALAADLERRVLSMLPAAQLYNTYGPTETTVQSTFWLCSPEPRNRSVPIGRPIANTAVYVLDSNCQPVPIGVEGELCIGGAGLARGYLDRPALTAEKFVPDAFILQPGERMYRTGDKVRWRRDGALEFLGRTDQQVKVRGFRIEPGEIESALQTHLKVREAAVIIRESSSTGTQIAAFVVPDKDSLPTIPELRQHIKALLPFYMRPSRYVLMERLPLNPNGKVDRNSLAQIQLPEETAIDILPNTATEKILCNIWAGVLKTEEVGVEDDFFALGGHSFLAVNLISQITRTFGRDLALDKIFQYPSPREMARFIDHSKKDTASLALVCMNKGSSELPPIYLMPPVIGNILCYSDLARSFSAQKPFYAIQALPADELKRTTVEEIAASYLQLIKKRDRQGRYELGGWSFGGMIAYEMAQQATAGGDPPAGLYLLDPPVLEKLADEIGPDEKLITLFVLTLIADFSGGKPLDMEKLQTEFGPEDRSLEGQLRKAIEFGFLPANTDVTAHIQPFALFKRNMRAAQMYHPQKYSGKTVMVLPETRRSEIWPTLLPPDVTTVRVPGNHFTILRGAHAATIAALIESGGF